MRFLKHPFGDGRAAVRAAVAPVPVSPVSDSERPVPVTNGANGATARNGVAASEDPRLHAVLWGASMGMWEMDLRSDTTHWVNDWCEHFGLDPCPGANHINRWDAAIHPEERSAKAARFGAMLAGIEPHYEAEYRIADRTGRWVWIVQRGSVIEHAPDGSPLRLVVMTREVGARKQAEEALRASEFRYRSVASMAPGYIFEYRFLSRRHRSSALGERWRAGHLRCESDRDHAHGQP